MIIGLQAAGEDGASRHRLHQERVHRAHGQLRHLARIEHTALGGAGGLQQRRFRSDIHRLRGRADLQLHVHRQAVADIQRDRAARGFLKAGGVDFDSVWPGSRKLTS